MDMWIMCKDEMKKKDLKNHYSVKLKNGERCLVLLDYPVFDGICEDILFNMSSQKNFIRLSQYNDDLTFSISCEVINNFDIMAVYRPKNVNVSLLKNDYELIWKREEDSFDDISKRLDETCLRLQTVLDEIGEGIELLKKELNIK